METVLIVIHLMIVLALVGVVLLQRSEGGGLGIGGGSGFMTARGAANALTRSTAILAAAFFATSLALSILARYGEQPLDILDRVPATTTSPQVPGGSGGILDQLGGQRPQQPAAPSAGQPAPAVPQGSDTAPAPAGEAPVILPLDGGASTAPAAPDATAPAAPAQSAPAQTAPAPAAPSAPADSGATQAPSQPSAPQSTVPSGQ